MNPDMQKELLARLDALTAKLGVAATSLWQIYLQQTRVALLQDALWLLLVVFMWFGWLYIRANAKRRYADDWKRGRLRGYSSDKEQPPYEFDFDDNPWDVASIFYGVVCSVGGVFITLICIGEIVQILLNPNYWVWSKILEQISNM